MYLFSNKIDNIQHLYIVDWFYIGIRLVLDWKKVVKQPKFYAKQPKNDPKSMLTRPKNIVDTLTVRT